MIERDEIFGILKNYDLDGITVGVLGSHSALDISRGAKKFGFKTLVVCQKGRDKTYAKYYKSREGKGVVDEVILLDKFSEITNPEVIEDMQSKNTIFLPHRSFEVYVGFEKIENEFKIPLFGSRTMLRAEERYVENNQYDLMEKGGIPYPKTYELQKTGTRFIKGLEPEYYLSPTGIDRLVIVKVAEAQRPYERAFFFASSASEYDRKSEEMIKQEYVFSWENIPGNDSKQLLKHLRGDRKIYLVKNAEIKKSDNGKTITVTNGENSLRFKLNEKEDKVILEIGGEKNDEYILKKENGKLNIYKQGKITPEALKEAVIEEFIDGTQFNLNFFYSAVNDELELLGTDTRRQTNLDGILRLPAPQQSELLKYRGIQAIEAGHIACTVKESLLEQVFELGEKFVKVAKQEYPPGIIGPFALQCALTPGPPKERFVCFDISMRVQGSPGTAFTPYSGYLYGESLSVGERIAMEVKKAVDEDRIKDVVT
ncbi:MAG: hypothetical protein A7316_01155 [Candidatus Altiarchaeales archaeon WOR_SM1_86-2]|nr:MAG: hypothetical protein A7316_01155 [Candidatus Altiarchaeales archaeon WOR_SM1_86-2]